MVAHLLANLRQGAWSWSRAGDPSPARGESRDGHHGTNHDDLTLFLCIDAMETGLFGPLRKSIVAIGLARCGQRVAEPPGVNAMTTSKEPGMGNEFIQRPSLAHGEETVGDPSEALGKFESSNRHAARILVVDDNVDLAQGLANLLQLFGHHVQVAYDGFSGLDKAKESNPEFILVDIGLPGLDGYQVASQIRREEGTKNAVILAIPGYGEDEHRRRTKEAGFHHHLVKPIACEDLIEILQSSR